MSMMRLHAERYRCWQLQTNDDDDEDFQSVDENGEDLVAAGADFDTVAQIQFGRSEPVADAQVLDSLQNLGVSSGDDSYYSESNAADGEDDMDVDAAGPRDPSRSQAAVAGSSSRERDPSRPSDAACGKAQQLAELERLRKEQSATLAISRVIREHQRSSGAPRVGSNPALPREGAKSREKIKPTRSAPARHRRGRVLASPSRSPDPERENRLQRTMALLEQRWIAQKDSAAKTQEWMRRTLETARAFKAAEEAEVHGPPTDDESEGILPDRRAVSGKADVQPRRSRSLGPAAAASSSRASSTGSAGRRKVRRTEKSGDADADVRMRLLWMKLQAALLLKGSFLIGVRLLPVGIGTTSKSPSPKPPVDLKPYREVPLVVTYKDEHGNQVTKEQFKESSLHLYLQN